MRKGFRNSMLPCSGSPASEHAATRSTNTSTRCKRNAAETSEFLGYGVALPRDPRQPATANETAYTHKGASTTDFPPPA